MLNLQGTYLASDPECNVTKGCFDDCKRGVCTFIVSWRDRRGYLDMEVKAHIPTGGDKWLAVGFSYDNRMVRKEDFKHFTIRCSTRVNVHLHLIPIIYR